MSDPIDLASDAALSALIDGELGVEDERALRARAAADPALATRLARFEALNRALRADRASEVRGAQEVEPGGAADRAAALAEGLAARIAADASRAGSGSLPLDDGPPVFPDESGAGEFGLADEPGVHASGIADESGGGEPGARGRAPGPTAVVQLDAWRRARRVALPLLAALAAALAVYAVVLRPSPAPSPDAARSDAPLLADETPGANGPGRSGTGFESAPPPAPEVVDAPELADPELAAPEVLELYALALDDEVVGPDFDVIDNLELLELLAALDGGAPRG